MTPNFPLFIVLALFSLFFKISFGSSSSESRSGGKVIISTKTSFSKTSSLKLEVVDLSCPQLLPNGQYSDIIVDHVTHIVRKYLEKNGPERYHVTPFAESFFSPAFDDVLLVMNVNIGILIPIILETLAKEYTDIAKYYNQLTEPLVPGSQQYETRNVKIKLATIVVQEASANSYKFSESQAIILLESIYRFGLIGIRYGLAVQALYTAISTKNLFSVYNMFVKYFDPSRQALPVLYIQIKDPKLEVIKTIFINLMARLFEKIILIDQIDNKEHFNNHACMLIASMISCNFLDDFIPMITDLLEKIDMIQLVSSPRFAKSLIDISNFYENQNIPLLDEISKRLIDDKILLKLDPKAFIIHGSIVSVIKINQNEFYINCVDSLSIEGRERLTEIELRYLAYREVVSESDAFDSINENFAAMENADLDFLCESIDKMITVFPDFFENHPSEANSVIIKVLALIPKLTNISMRQSSKALDIHRYRLFIKLLELCFTGPYIFESTTEVFSIVLGFYNTRFNSLYLYDVHIKTLNLIQILVKTNKFFKTHRYRANFYTYLKIVAPLCADSCMTKCLYEVLFRGYNLPFIYSNVIATSNKLELSINSAISTFISNEIRKYLEVHDQIPADIYLDGSLVHLVELVLAENILSKTEAIIVKTVLNRNSSYRIFTD